LRNVLLRWVALGIVLALLLGLATFGAWDWWIGMALILFHLDEATLARIVLDFFSDVRFLLLFLLLAPALSLHWTIRNLKKLSA
jgi:hypothetical protein